ncbi:hypothetical protein O3W44_02340 [Pantoea sp. LMR881]|uniref:hypothetical protein n=1 Tax=Pantoea sp. LMR881 TaxID=3014336 RepID=UPI0022AEDD48|nr:hypothetical protein [Pantoea sp. LMR881]MCZ4058180.1 hypothetical protein [Pantoea sp. LMR881]
MNNLLKITAIFTGIMIGYAFLNGACISEGSYAAPRELSEVVVTIFTLLSSIDICLKVIKFFSPQKKQTS